MLATAAVVLAAAFTAAGCGDDSTDENTSPAASAETTVAETEESDEAESSAEGKTNGGGEPVVSTVEIKASDSEFGKILFDGDDGAIYLFDKESTEKSECYGACAEAWPPVLTDGDPVAGQGIDQDLLGTTERDDGKAQATYNGHPLYYYVDDPPGEVLCHNVYEFGGLWLVLTPDGDAVS